MSHTYLLFRPPFALKVRASFPSKGNTSFDEAISAFVHAVIPEIKVTFPANCKGLKTTIYVDPDGAACELPLRLVEAFQKTAEFGCEDYESAEEMNALLPKLVAECEAESGAEPNAKPGK